MKLPSADRLLVVFSDVEMGAGGVVDDFPHSSWLGELMLSYNEGPFAELPVDVIFNGDTFDLLKTSYLDAYPRHITADVALGKMSRIAAAHPKFFEAVRQLLSHTGAPRRVFFVTGNHDTELFFPEVQHLVKTLCGGSEAIHFPGLTLNVGRVHIEHGAQRDNVFRIDPAMPTVEYEGKTILNISWGAAACLECAIPLQPLLHFHDRLKPKKEVLRLMPEIKDLFTQLFWQYWTRDYWKGYFSTRDPTKKISWSMVKEAVWRLTVQEAEVIIDDSIHDELEASNEFMLYLIGHLHQPTIWSHGDRKIIQTGCIRNEYMMADEGKSLKPIAKSYAEVYMRGDEPVVSQMLEVEGPPDPAGYVPESVFDVIPTVRDMLAEQANDEKTEKERVEQEKREAKEAKAEAKRAKSA